MWNIKTLALTVQKLLARLKFQRTEWQTGQKNTICPPIVDLGGIKKTEGEVGILYLYLGKVFKWSINFPEYVQMCGFLTSMEIYT